MDGYSLILNQRFQFFFPVYLPGVLRSFPVSNPGYICFGPDYLSVCGKYLLLYL